MPICSKQLARLLMATAAASGLAACGGSNDPVAAPAQTPAPAPAPTPAAAGTRATFAVLETTDLHANVRSFDYFKLADDPSYGYERTSTLIRAARAEFPNTFLVDNGDTVQGTALADYEATVSPIACGQLPSIYRAMKATGFDAGTLGNHEFNYGLDYLNRIVGGGLQVDGVDGTQKCADPGFPLVLSNIVSNKTQQPLFKPYTIVTKQLRATQPDGSTVTVPVKVGVIGFTTPGILNWDKRFLEGKVSTVGAVESAQKYIPQMRAEGAQLVVALLHGGLDGSAYDPTMENPGLYLSKVAGIDAMVMGHQHGLFPDRGTAPAYKQTGVDNTAGTVNGVPAVMASSWGKALGVIRMDLVWNGSTWSVDKSKTMVEARQTAIRDATTGVTTYLAADTTVAPLVEAQHQAAVTYVKTPVGSTDFRMSTYFADVGDPGAIQIVNAAQADYVSRYVRANLPQYAGLPVLSVSAPFKSGYEGGRDFTDVAAGNLAIFNAADLYLFPNTVYAVKVNGAEVKGWLEAAAKRFNRIDPALTTDQQLVSTFPGYNFDMFTTPDVQYRIDVTQPVGSRIRDLTYLGQPMSATQDFVIATNNYRATSGGATFIPALDGRATIYASPDANRDVLIAYIKAHPTVTRATDGSARSWRFAPVTTAGRVVFGSGPGVASAAQAAGVVGVSQVAADDGTGKGRALYSIDLSQQ